jgi:hypothetical protein
MTRFITICAVWACLAGMTFQSAAQEVAASPNGIAFPVEYQNWRVIAVSHRSDNNTLRVILGNDDAIAAARSGQTNPWPDGAILGKVVWKDGSIPEWPQAQKPETFVHAEFMFRDATKYASTGGWGWARWKGMGQEPHGDANVAQECVACHTPVKDNNWVFTRPAPLPAVVK